MNSQRGDIIMHWFKYSPTELAERLGSNLATGLSLRRAKRRLEEKGPNKLSEEEKESWWSVFSRQFEDLMIIILMITTIVSALLGEVVDAVAILAIIVLNAILGFVQEYRAEKSLSALKQLTAPKSKVLREQRQLTIDAEEIVPGDIIVLEAGDRVPADARLINVNSLYVEEATLTGESIPVEKHPNAILEDYLSLGDQANMLFMGTLITRGKCKALVVATGMNTEIGKIAGMIQNTMVTETPLQKRLQVLGKWLVLACLVIVSIVFIAGVLRGFPVYKMFLTGVSLAVAAIPEGLPAVVTIALAIGVQRMIRRNAIIRQLPAVETLGCATVICSDKTGTLTQNKMKVQKYWLNGMEVDITQTNNVNNLIGHNPLLRQALLIGMICNSAQETSKGSEVKVTGDPTEAALVSVAANAHLHKSELEGEYQVLHELPFDSERKRMSVLVKHEHQYYSYVKGAPGIILERCTKIITKNGIESLSAKRKQEITFAAEKFGEEALRILSFAYRPLKNETKSEHALENDLIFVGIVGMIDPPRPEAKRSIKQARRAGIRTIMVTGDHKLTAKAIADNLAISENREAQVMTGNEWALLSELEQQKAVATIDVFARVAPQHKLSIVKALQRNGEIVGMTGDGVNDAPAVKEADIGISMGVTGTDVTKEASAMILLDDNFQTIISAIEEGRSIYDNIRKFIRYLLACNVGEVLTMFFATVAGLPLPLVPIQILWMNLVTDGLPAIALGVDSGDTDTMSRKPRDPHEGIFARKLHLKIGFTGLLISFCALAVFALALFNNPHDLIKARTLAFTTLVMAQLIFVFQCRSEYHSIFEIGFFSNPFLVIAVAVSGLMHLLVVYHPWFQVIFNTVALNLDDWLLVIVFSVLSLVIDTLARMMNRHVKRRFSLLRVR